MDRETNKEIDKIRERLLEMIQIPFRFQMELAWHDSGPHVRILLAGPLGSGTLTMHPRYIKKFCGHLMELDAKWRKDMESGYRDQVHELLLDGEEIDNVRVTDHDPKPEQNGG
jgi:hypothetical protein